MLDKKMANRLNRVEGQIRGLAQMIEQKRSCEETLIQLGAAKSALEKIGILLISERMKECLKEKKSEKELVKNALEIFLKHFEHVR